MTGGPSACHRDLTQAPQPLDKQSELEIKGGSATFTKPQIRDMPHDELKVRLGSPGTGTRSPGPGRSEPTSVMLTSGSASLFEAPVPPSVSSTQPYMDYLTTSYGPS